MRKYNIQLRVPLQPLQHFLKDFVIGQERIIVVKPSELDQALSDGPLPDFFLAPVFLRVVDVADNRHLPLLQHIEHFIVKLAVQSEADILPVLRFFLNEFDSVTAHVQQRFCLLQKRDPIMVQMRMIVQPSEGTDGSIRHLLFVIQRPDIVIRRKLYKSQRQNIHLADPEVPQFPQHCHSVIQIRQAMNVHIRKLIGSHHFGCFSFRYDCANR